MSVYQFDDFGEMIDFIEAAKSAADQQVQAWQRAIAPSDYVLSYAPEMDLVIYNQVLEPEPHEPPLNANVRIVQAYSEVVPNGEYGLFHIANAVCSLTQAAFEMARQDGWPSDSAYMKKLMEAH